MPKQFGTAFLFYGITVELTKERKLLGGLREVLKCFNQKTTSLIVQTAFDHKEVTIKKYILQFVAKRNPERWSTKIRDDFYLYYKLADS